jgi:hypothetical protein
LVLLTVAEGRRRVKANLTEGGETSPNLGDSVLSGTDQKPDFGLTYIRVG